MHLQLVHRERAVILGSFILQGKRTFENCLGEAQWNWGAAVQFASQPQQAQSLLAEQPHALDKCRHDALLVPSWQLSAQASSQFAERIALGLGIFSGDFRPQHREALGLQQKVTGYVERQCVPPEIFG